MQPASRYEIREELKRILESPLFSKAKKRSRFLEFICEQTLQGNAEKLNEYLIGVDVYERGADFNPQADAIVRVQASEIRRALKEYFSDTGRQDPWRIDVPAGAYVPVFTRSVEEPPLAPRPPETVALKPSGFLPRFGLPLALAAAAALFFVLWIRDRSGVRHAEPRLSPSVAAGADWFWKPFLPPAAPPLIVLPNHPLLRAAHEGDSLATVGQGHRIAKDKLPQFRDTIHFRELREFLFVPDTTDFTGIGEALGLLNVFEFLSAAGQKMQVKPTRLVDFEALKRGNAILFGGNQSWSGRIFLYPEGFRMQAGVIANKTPRRRELSVYKPEFDAVTNGLRRDHALILMLPNENHDQRILLAYGIYTQGTQAAMEYITSADRLRELRGELLAQTPGSKVPPRFFQVLITTTVENEVPGKVSFVAARVMPE